MAASKYIYRTIDLRIWGDEKVRRLSRPPPNGRDLFLYLLTAKESIAIPGVIPAGAAAMAETLRWPVEGFRDAFAEAFREGLAKADWEAPLVWVPNAIRYNPPQAPNVVRNWAKAWVGVPDSKLKPEIWRTLKAFTEGMGEAFAKAFADGFPEPSPHTSPNQDQDQDQDQKEDLASAVAPAIPPVQAVQQPPPPKKERKPSQAQEFLAWAQQQRALKTSDPDDVPDVVTLNATLKPLISELGIERLKAGYVRRFLEDEYARRSCSPAFPWGLFVAKARTKYCLLSAVTTEPGGVDPARLVRPDDDPYADEKPIRRGGS